jgi:hypothetical protein
MRPSEAVPVTTPMLFMCSTNSSTVCLRAYEEEQVNATSGQLKYSVPSRNFGFTLADAASDDRWLSQVQASGDA